MAEILFLAHRAPWPPDRGDRIRSWHLLKALAALAPVHIAALVDDPTDAAAARPVLEPLAASLFQTPRSTGKAAALVAALSHGTPLSVELFAAAALQAHVDRLLATRPISHIVAFSSQMAQFVPAAFAGRFVMDFVDVDSAKFAAYARADPLWHPLRWVHAREGRLLARYEAAVAARADTSLFVSAAEAALFRERTGLGPGRVQPLANGIDLDRFDPAGDWVPLGADRPAGRLAVFTGQMDYRPNIAAVELFARQILPRLRAVHPDTGFAIVGRAPTAEVRALGGLPGVIVTGEVADTRPWLAAADCVVAPLSIARGVQNKLLEAMAMARPVVASRAALEGIEQGDTAIAVAADGAEDTAEAIAALWADAERAHRLGQAARARMVAHYGWEAALAPLAGLLNLTPAPIASVAA